nr:protein FAR1-RELATED SEQUENCE 5-like [Setaria viridis]
MAVGSQEKDNVPDSSPMVSSVPALAHNGMQPTQIAQNYSDDNIRVCCMIPEEIGDEAPDKMADEVVQPMIVPEVGMAFESEDKAYEMYNTYAGKHPSTIFTDQDAAMAGAIAYVFPNTSHRLCLWHIYLNAAKHLGHVIQKHPDKFLPDFKRCVYEDRSEFYFKKKWDELLRDYNLEDNKWMENLYDLRAKWAAVYRDSFTADMNSTQRSEGINNVFKKRFRRKLGLSELLEECEKVSSSLRNNELDEDFNSRRKSPVTHIPLLKTAAESYTGRMYKEFEEEFNKQFSFSCILCKHAFKVFNVNDVFILPSQYIQHRWTKYAKRGFYIQKQGSEEESLKTHAARISRKATSIALKCSKSKELLDLLEEAMDKLDLDADNYLSKMEEQSNEAPLVSADFATDTFKGEESNNVAENSYEGASPDKFIDLNDGSVDANSTIPHFNMHGNSSVMSLGRSGNSVVARWLNSSEDRTNQSIDHEGMRMASASRFGAHDGFAELKDFLSIAYQDFHEDTKGSSDSRCLHEMLEESQSGSPVSSPVKFFW